MASTCHACYPDVELPVQNGTKTTSNFGEGPLDAEEKARLGVTRRLASINRWKECIMVRNDAPTSSAGSITHDDNTHSTKVHLALTHLGTLATRRTGALDRT